ncbi:hypothetical protein HS088_TW03G00194 [Tripterygium wilfordii]|uniref:At3g05675-like ankyrin-like domain-containing protein n=1 Tax=Tripterygium wilfordii TaxID=458696 RepID=A0A7J7DU14_TRIWF|nr:uncharacterized protein LOC119986725 [Tripterygium wilfordii]KAF5749868.1 hypothetical protein HS088_TW03G00194 [Tripterygium wilfordii]
MAISKLHMEKYRPKPGNIMSSIIMYTVNTAAKMLVSVAASAKADLSRRWRPADHLRFMGMLMTWVTVWFLRVLMDYVPFVSLTSSPHKLLGGLSSFGLFDLALPCGTSSNSSSWDYFLSEGGDDPSLDGLGRSLTHILEILNDIPATSRKYQFAMAMADKIMEGNARYGNVELMEVNRTALASAFSRTSSLLYRTLQQTIEPDDSATWTSLIVRRLPLGSYIAPYMKGLHFCLNSVSTVIQTLGTFKDQLIEKSRRRRRPRGAREWEIAEEELAEVAAEKLGQELLWITHKLKAYDAVGEALVQWSFASGLASVALSVDSRIQSFILKISAILFVELVREDLIVSQQVKYRMLVLWLPLLCHASNGLTYPVLTSYEKAETERAMDEAIMSLPAADQEVILNNWIQDFTVSASEWPNLQTSYDHWCESTRELLA